MGWWEEDAGHLSWNHHTKKSIFSLAGCLGRGQIPLVLHLLSFLFLAGLLLIILVKGQAQWRPHLSDPALHLGPSWGLEGKWGMQADGMSSKDAPMSSVGQNEKRDMGGS